LRSDFFFAAFFFATFFFASFFLAAFFAIWFSSFLSMKMTESLSQWMLAREAIARLDAHGHPRDGINLGLTKMAEACPGTSFAKLSWLSSWHVRDETYLQALAVAQLSAPIAAGQRLG
jgi:Tn3 transposase DDE domain